MKNNTLSVEIPIDVVRLLEVLYETYCAQNSNNKLPELFMHIKSSASTLKSNIAKGRLGNFLRQLRKVFSANGDLQFQLLMIDFIKDTLEPYELEKFMAQVATVSRGTLSMRTKSTIIAELH